VAWQDCRFRRACTSNDIVFSTSNDGVRWSDARRIPIESDTSNTVDHFIPGIAVEPATAGGSARLGLTYYFYDDAACGSACQLKVGFAQSDDGGRTGRCSNPSPDHSTSTRSPTPAKDAWSATTSHGAFAVGNPPTGAAFNEAIFIPTRRLTLTGSVHATRSQAVTATTPDHPITRSARGVRRYPLTHIMPGQGDCCGHERSGRPATSRGLGYSLGYSADRRVVVGTSQPTLVTGPAGRVRSAAHVMAAEITWPLC
jgi:hypothetical protein